MSEDRIAILFVCLGNICRSPLAEAIFRKVVTDEGLEHHFEIDSAGTAAYHVGEPPYRRSAEVARRRGVTVSGSARQVDADDLRERDYLIAMDRSNLAALERLAAEVGGDAEMVLLRAFDPEADGDAEVPDPYYGGPRGFEDVHDMVERSCRGLLEHLREHHAL